MSEQYRYGRVKQAKDTHANWTAENPVPYYGEIIIATEVEDAVGGTAIKIGDGETCYNDLPWWSEFSSVRLSEKGAAMGVVPLDQYGKISPKYLPVVDSSVAEASYVSAYTGAYQVPDLSEYDTDGLLFTGTTVAREPGVYHMAAKPVGAVWDDDMSQDTRFIEWEIMDAE